MPIAHLTHDGPTAVLILDRPPANAIDLDLLDVATGHLHDLAAEPPPGGLVLTGEGAMFSGGVDYKAVQDYGRQNLRAMVRGINRMAALLYGLQVPTIAAVNGHAMGGGLVLALACDYRIIAEGSAKLALAEVSAGIPFPGVPLEIIKAELEPNLSRRLALTGEPLSPREAEARGVVDAVVAPRKLAGKAIETAQTLSGYSAYRAIKAQLKRATMARIGRIVEEDDDPLMSDWLGS